MQMRLVGKRRPVRLEIPLSIIICTLRAATVNVQEQLISLIAPNHNFVSIPFIINLFSKYVFYMINKIYIYIWAI